MKIGESRVLKMGVMAGLMLALGGCSHATGGSGTDTQYTADQLGLMVLKAGEDQDLPSREIHEGVVEGTDQREVDGEDVTFDNTIALPNLGSSPTVMRGANSPIFFAWNADALGPEIQEAFYSLRLRDETNRVTGEPTSTPVSYDPLTHRWYIPFVDLFRDRTEPLDPATVYALGLDLDLMGHPTVHINVYFRVLGSLPAVGVLPLPLDQSDMTPTTSEPPQAFSPRVISKERVTNPSEHELLLWVSSGTGVGSDLKLDSVLEETLIDPDGGRHLEARFSSSADFDVAEVRLIRQTGSGSPERRDVHPGRSGIFALGPKESVVLEWLAHPVANVNVCVVPPMQTIPIWLGSSLHLLSQISGSELSGSYSRSLSVTDYVPGMEQESGAPTDYPEALFPRIRVVQSGLEHPALRNGSDPHQNITGAWDCQGIF